MKEISIFQSFYKCNYLKIASLFLPAKLTEYASFVLDKGTARLYDMIIKISPCHGTPTKGTSEERWIRKSPVYRLAVHYR